MKKSAEVRLGDAYLTALAQGELTEKAHIIEALSVKWFRINILYYIKDKGGRKIKFHPNAAQRERYVNGHSRNIILKARQLGFTTFEMIDALDDCLFTDNFSAGCICHNLDDAKDIFRNKITFAYRHIPDTWLALFEEIGLRFPRPVSDKGGSGAYVFDNGSSINVSTSYRGGTLQRLHVSEFGKICKQFPHKAQEIVTGAFEAVGLGNQITLESTAEGGRLLLRLLSGRSAPARIGSDANGSGFPVPLLPLVARASLRHGCQNGHGFGQVARVF